jgi:hypothetical protein
MRGRLRLLMDSPVSEGFFARAVVLVEGLADAAMLRGACPRCWALAPGVPADGTSDSDTTVVTGVSRASGLGGIVYVAIKLYRNHARAFIGLAAIVVVPVQILSAFTLAAVPDETEVFVQTRFPTPFAPPPIVDTSALLVSLAGRLVTFGLALIATQLVAALSPRAVADAYLGNRPKSSTSLSFTFGRIGPLVRLAVVTTTLIGVGLVLGIVPGVWLYAAWAVAAPVLLVEGERGASALRRSVQLVRRRWLAVLGVLVVSRIIASLSGLVIGSALRAAGSVAGTSGFAVLIVDTFASATAATLVTPFLAVTIVLLARNAVDLRPPGVPRAGNARPLSEPPKPTGHQSLS